jgi:hypothetical protein
LSLTDTSNCRPSLWGLREIEIRVRRQCRYPGSDKVGYGSDGVNIEGTHGLRYFIFLNLK